MTDDQSPQLAGTTPADDQTPVLGGTREVLHLLELTRHEDEAIRQRAIFELAERGDERMMDALRQLATHDDKPVRLRVVWSLAVFESPAAYDLLFDIAVEGGGSDMVELAARLSARLMPFAELKPRLAALLASHERTEHEAALRILKHCPTDGAGVLMVQFLRRTDLWHGDYMRAIEVVGLHPTQAAFQVLEESIGTGLDRQILRAMLHQGLPEAVSVALRLWHGDAGYEAATLFLNRADRATLAARLPHFRDMLEASDNLNRTAAVRALGGLATDEALRLLAQHLPYETDTYVQLELMRRLEPFLTPELHEVLRTGIAHPHLDHALNTVEAIGGMADATPFAAALIDRAEGLDTAKRDDYHLLLEIMRALTGPPAREFLRPLLAHPNDTMRSEALIALARNGEWQPPTAEVSLYNQLHACAKFGRTEALPWLLNIEEHADHRRAAWLEALALCGGESVIPRVAAYLGDTRHNVHQTAIWALGKLGAAAYTPQLMAIVTQVDDERSLLSVRFTSVVALGQLGDARALPLLRRLTRDHYDTTLHALAAEALGNLRDAESLPLLAEHLRWSLSMSVMTNTATALGVIGEPATLPHLITALGSGYGDVRLAAVNAIAAIGPDAAAREALHTLIEHEPHRRIHEAAQALL